MTGRISLTELQLIIRDSLYLALPGFYWVFAEISEIKQNHSGHCYLELIEKQDDDLHPKARIKAIIWSNRYSFIKSFFENSTGESLREGLKVLVKGRIEYHELYGLSLVITDIDPAFTIGEMAARRQLIIKKLEQEGVFGMNKELDLPIVPQKIAIISSRDAAGYTDFMNHLKGNSLGYQFYTALFDSVMQGPETEKSVINAFERIALKADLFEVVVIIRGGGSQSDLSWFDNYNIAYYVTQFPLPVITGIGHDKDLSVTDMVACEAMKTPTAVADFFIECAAETENHILEISSEIKRHALYILEENRSRLDKSKNILAPLARILIAGVAKSLSAKVMSVLNMGKEKTFRAGIMIANNKMRLTSAARSLRENKQNLIEDFKISVVGKTTELLKKNDQKLNAHKETLNILKPENILKRGYTITTINGKILKSAAGPAVGEIIDTIFSDGTISGRIIGKSDNNISNTET